MSKTSELTSELVLESVYHRVDRITPLSYPMTPVDLLAFLEACQEEIVTESRSFIPQFLPFLPNVRDLVVGRYFTAAQTAVRETLTAAITKSQEILSLELLKCIPAIHSFNKVVVAEGIKEPLDVNSLWRFRNTYDRN
ncbi:hypothetical protein PAPYR_7688 [Paratrimastix pyriformis]|uniref:Uncharacterized protein n=1 Tax=Paratrimastix pyriformis TaxID=342808 RepID=A0ABQ8UGY4_9EUKA|nr:hypothetical protein PAPYR_7688 [Paratrimastix pyriformis]